MEDIKHLAELHISPQLGERLRWLGDFQTVLSSLQASALTAFFSSQQTSWRENDVDLLADETRRICDDWRELDHFDKANKLEALMTKFKDQCSKDDITEGTSILRFLLALAQPDVRPSYIGYIASTHSQRHNLETLLRETSPSAVYPTHRPLHYSDTCVSRDQQPVAVPTYGPEPYMQYNRDVFASLVLSSEEATYPGGSECRGQPVADWLQACSRPYWMQQAQHDMIHSGDGHLFGAVSHGHISHLEQQLQIPELAVPADGKEARLSDVLTSLRSTAASDDSSLDHLQQLLFARMPEDAAPSSTCVLEKATRQTYLSEAGPDVFDVVLQEQSVKVRQVDNASGPSGISFKISQAELISDCCRAMLGAPSLTFPEAKDGCLTVECKRSCGGYSVLGLQHVLLSIADWGNTYRRLHHLTTGSLDSRGRPTKKITSNYSLVQRSFLDGLVSYLQCYRAALLDICSQPACHNLLSLQTLLSPLGRQLRFLLSISTAASGGTTELLNTCQLLTSLYDQASQHQHSQHYTAILHLFNAALQPYLQFLHRWLERGQWDDKFGEFFVSVDEQSLARRDGYYWSKGYSIASNSQNEPLVPSFLQPVVDKLISCGKAIDLLQECCPDHPFISEDISPMQIGLRFSLEGLNQAKISCMEFIEQREDLLRKLREGRPSPADELDQAMRLAAEQRKEKLKAEEEEALLRRQARHEEKQRLGDEQRTNLEAEKQRRAELVAKERKEDAAIIQGLVDRDEKRVRLEEEARAELVAQYQQLSADADSRRQRSEWRAKRFALQNERLKVLAADASGDGPSSPSLVSSAGTLDISLEKETLPPMKQSDQVVQPVTDAAKDIPDLNLLQPDDKHVGEHTDSNVAESDSVAPPSGISTTAAPSSTVGKDVYVVSAQTEEPHKQQAAPVQLLHSAASLADLPAIGSQSASYVTLPAKSDVSIHSDSSSVISNGSTVDGVDSDSLSISSQYSIDGGSSSADVDSDEMDAADPVTSIASSMAASGLKPLSINFSGLDKMPAVCKSPSQTSNDDHVTDDGNLDAIDAFPLSVIAMRCLLDPIVAQWQVANAALVQLFRLELNIGGQFAALRRFLLLECGEFGQALGERLFYQLSSGQSVHDIRSPMALSDLLTHALQQSQLQDSIDAERLSFSIRRTTGSFKPFAVGAFNFLRINYQVEWPLNIVISSENMSTYNKIFLFLLEMKRASWLLKDCLFYLKSRIGQDAKRNRLVYRSPQFRQIQLFRHEMQHFVQSVEGYLSNQVIQVSWKEFQVDLAEVRDLDRLIFCHSEYLRKMLFRSFLSQKAAPVMKVVVEVLSTVLRFHTQLVSGSWRSDTEEGINVTHSNFTALTATHRSFKKYSGFLFNVVTKMVERGYQSHLEEFLLCLNFNAFYKPISKPLAP